MKRTEQIAKQFARAAESYPQAAIVQRRMAQHLAALLPKGFSARRILEFGVGSGFLTEALLNVYPTAEWVLNDLSPSMASPLLVQDLPPHEWQWGDIEQLAGQPHLGKFGLIASSAALQWLRAPIICVERLLTQHLMEGGWLLLATFGVGNLREITSLTARTLPYTSQEQWRNALEGQLDHLYIEEQEITLTFDSPLEVLRHLRATGVNRLPGYSTPALKSRRDLEQFIAAYRSRFGLPNGQVSLTYIPLCIAGQRPVKAGL